MRYTPCETHRRIGAEIERIVQRTTTADELKTFAGLQGALLKDVAGCPDCKKSVCSDCGACNVEAWSPYASYCYRCGSKGCADVNAPWIEASPPGIEKELALLAVYHRDGSDLAPRALQWLQRHTRSSS